MFVIPDDLPIELTPFTFLLGHWSGSGVVSYPVQGKDPVEVEFFQEMQFLPLPNGKLEYQAISRQADGSVISQEHGFWMLAKNTLDHEPGPGLLPGKAESTIQSREQLEEFRNATGGFDIEAIVTNSDAVSELYFGQIKAARVDIATDAVLRSPHSKEYSAGQRMYGLVEGALLWAWDMAALGKPLSSHASARLEKKND